MISQEWKPEVSLEQVNEFYFSRLIDSLERDYDQWEMKHCGGGPGWTWTEWHGPEYKNEAGERLQFAFTLNYNGAYINGRIGWTVSPLQYYNIFSYRTRRFRKAMKRMKKHLKYVELKQRTEKLIKSL